MEVKNSLRKSVYLLSHQNFVSRMKLTPVRRRRRFSVKSNATSKTPKVISFVKNSSRLFGQRLPPPRFSVVAKARRRFSIRGRTFRAEAKQAENPLIIVDLPPGIAHLSAKLPNVKSGGQRAPAKNVMFKDSISFSNPWNRTHSEDPALTSQRNRAATPLHGTCSPSPAPRSILAHSASVKREATPAELFAFPLTPPLSPASSPPRHRSTTAPPLFPTQIPLLNTLKAAPAPSPRKDRGVTMPKPELKGPASTDTPTPALFVQRNEVGSSKGRRTVWYESVDPDPIESPALQGWLFPGDIYVHLHRKGRQAWLRDDTGDWIWAYDGRVHPTDSDLVLQFSNSGEPAWVRQN